MNESQRKKSGERQVAEGTVHEKTGHAERGRGQYKPQKTKSKGRRVIERDVQAKMVCGKNVSVKTTCRERCSREAFC